MVLPRFVPQPARLFGTLSIMVLLGAAPAVASSIPSSANPERITPPSLSNTITLAPPPAEEPPPEVSTLPRPANAEALPLTLNAIALEGASVYSEAELAELWQPLLGQDITLADIYTLADRITAKYRDNGYVLARAYLPPQEIADGTVRLVVAEGKINEVRFESTFGEPALVGVVLEKIRRLQALNIKKLENQLLMLGDLPGSNFRVVLQPAGNGQVNVVVIGEKEATVSGEASFDNSGSRYLGPYLLTGRLDINNLTGMFHQTTLSVATALQLNELSQAAISHSLPLGRPGLKLTLDAAYTRGEPGYVLEDDDIDSKTQQLGLRLDWQVLRQRLGSLTLSTGFNTHDSETRISGTPFTDDSIRSLYVSARYDWRDFVDGYNIAEVKVTRGLPGLLGGSDNGDLDLSRAAGRADFSKIELILLRHQPVNQLLTLFGGITAQASANPLLSSEEFGYGGSFIGRAYDPSEMTGDSGISGLIELRLRPLEVGRLGMLEPFVFADYGAVWNRDAGQEAFEEGASLGIGARLETRHNISAEASLAQPLIDSDASTYRNLGGPRFLFATKVRF